MGKAKDESDPQKGKEVALRSEAGLPAPAYIEDGKAGLENVEASDAVFPRAVLLQALSPPVVEERGPDFVAGAVMNSLVGEVWVKKDEAIDFIPVFHFKQWIRWGDRDSGEGILASSLMPDSELALSARAMGKRRLDGGREIIDVTEYHNFVALFPTFGPHRLMILTCCRTNHKKGRLLLGLAQYRNGRPLYSGKYEMSTILETNRRNQKYYVYDFRNNGWCPQELYPVVKELYASFKEAQSARVDWGGEQEDATGADTETEM